MKDNRWRPLLAGAAMLLLLSACMAEEGGLDTVKGTLEHPVETEFFTVTASNPRWGEPLEEPLPQGVRCLWVDVSVTNSGSENKPLYYDEFELLADGNYRFPQPVGSERQLAESQELEQGQTISGCLVFHVPEDAGSLVLVYETYYQQDVRGNRYEIPLPNPQ